MYIQTEVTPNPNAIKFIPGILVSPIKHYYFTDASQASNSFLARKILSTQGINSVFLSKDFITVVKEEKEDWDILKPETIIIIMDHLTSGLTIFDTVEKNENESIKHSNEESRSEDYNVQLNTEIEKQIFEIIETKVRPAVAMDGGDIIYRGFENGIVKLELMGACSGCPSSTITLKKGIESMLKHYIPEVIAVESI